MSAVTQAARAAAKLGRNNFLGRDGNHIGTAADIAERRRRREELARRRVRTQYRPEYSVQEVKGSSVAALIRTYPDGWSERLCQHRPPFEECIERAEFSRVHGLDETHEGIGVNYS